MGRSGVYTHPPPPAEGRAGAYFSFDPQPGRVNVLCGKAMVIEVKDNLHPLLLAEDEENDVFFMRLALKQAGVANTLVAVPDGEAAIEYLEGTGIYADRGCFPLPCVLITDIKMPKVDGFELLQWVQRRRQFDTLPKLVISSSCLDRDLERCLEYGASAYYRKPSDHTKLIELVRGWKGQWIEPGCSRPVPAEELRS